MGSATAAGFIAGALVGGIGGRAVMRISAIAADSDGVLTENGNIVGEITFAGTLTFIIFGGGLAGLAGGLLLYAVLPWLPSNLALRSLLFAVLLPLIAATTVINSANVDFFLLSPAELNVAMFGVLFVLFGAVVVPIEDGILRLLPPSASGSSEPISVVTGAVVMIPMAIPA
jgi:hypothetical protein